MWQRRWARWMLGAAGWSVLGLLSASRIFVSYSYTGYSITWKRALALALTDWYAWAVVAPAILWLARRVTIERRSWLRSVLIHLPASVVFSVLKMTIEFFGIQQLDPHPSRRFPFLQVPSTIFTYGAILGVLYAFDYYRKYRAHELKASQLEARLAQAQLEALKMQLHPHFLFNTLHAISSLMHQDVEAADGMITRLSDLLRLTIENAGAQEIPLKQELDFLERYLEIEQLRFGDRLQVRMEIDAEALDALVPHWILQPVVENSIRHGMAPRSTPGRIEISAARRNEKLRLQVRDDGPGLPNGTTLREGIGLANTRARLQQLYGAEAHHFEFGNRSEGGWQVTLEFPFREVSGLEIRRGRKADDQDSGIDR